MTETDKIVEMTCSKFADALAAKTSVPGGGGAAAYMGALSIALCSMVGNFTIGKKKYAAYEEDLRRLMSESEQIRARLIKLVDEDAAAFYPLSQAYSIPKEDPLREKEIEKRTKDALTCPLEMMRQVARVIEILEETHMKGSHMLMSDVGCGATCAAAAMRAAAMNVFVNTKLLHDHEYADKIHAEADKLLAYARRADTVVETVITDLRS